MGQEININFSYKSSNCDERPIGTNIDAIVIHYTEVSFEESIKLLTNSQYKTSSHYLISENGEIYNLVPEEKRAWHAGISYWNGRDKVNDFSIGIEIVNDGINQYTNEQIGALINLLKHLKIKHNVKNNNIIGHSDIAFERKKDPGVHFPWQELKAHNLCIYHDISEDNMYIIYKKGDCHPEIKKIKDMMNKIGYKVDFTEEYTESMEMLVKAFQMRYNQASITGMLDNLTIKIIHKILESVDV